MAHINTTQYALLGMLSYMPMSGYDLKKFIDQSISFFWSENYGHIYPVLKKLEQEKFVTKRVEHNQGKPSKNIYSITQEGLSVLTDWLAAPVQKEIYRLEILLKLFFGYLTETGTMIEKVAVHKKTAEKTLRELLDIENHINTQHHDLPKNKPPYQLLCLNYGKHFYNMVIKWCDETLGILQAAKNNQQ
ncbi:MAG: PadR family transcriptional regulator [Spirochaetales bacterium]|nr:PadR family transcriptional regulator [Spirochaetales bacterium]